MKNNFPVTDVAKQFKKTLIDVIDKRLGCIENNKTAAKATFLNPRFKRAAFATEANVDRAQKYVVEDLTWYLNDQKTSSTLNSFHNFKQQNTTTETVGIF